MTPRGFAVGVSLTPLVSLIGWGLVLHAIGVPAGRLLAVMVFTALAAAASAVAGYRQWLAETVLRGEVESRPTRRLSTTAAVVVLVAATASGLTVIVAISLWLSGHQTWAAISLALAGGITLVWVLTLSRGTRRKDGIDSAIVMHGWSISTTLLTGHVVLAVALALLAAIEGDLLFAGLFGSVALILCGWMSRRSFANKK